MRQTGNYGGNGRSGNVQGWWTRNQQALVPYLFIAPNLLVFTVFMFVPILFAFYISLNEWSLIGSPTFIGLGNYIEMMQDERFWRSFYNTIVYTIGTVPVSIALGLAVAIGLNRKLPARGLLRSIFFVPVVISMVAVALVAAWIFNDNYGVINNALNSLGFGSVPWLSSPTWAMPSLIITTLWIRIGFCMVVYLAALQSIPGELYEAARVDGATGWKQFRHITWPMLSATTFLLLILNVIYSLHVFDLIYVMTGGGPGFSTTVLVQYIYLMAFESSEMGYASAVGVVLYIMLLIFTLFQWRVTGQGEGTS